MAELPVPQEFTSHEWPRQGGWGPKATMPMGRKEERIIETSKAGGANLTIYLVAEPVFGGLDQRCQVRGSATAEAPRVAGESTAIDFDRSYPLRFGTWPAD